MKPVAELIGLVLGPRAGMTTLRDDDSGGDCAEQSCDPHSFSQRIGRTVRAVDSTQADTTQRGAARAMTLEDAASITRSGDVWLFTGRKLADRAIRAATNSPVNHVAMVLAIDDLPPLLWHAELGRSMPDVWTGELQRGAQLHRLTDAADTWVNRYGQRAFFRQLDPIASIDMENAALAVVQELSGRRFPTTLGLVAHWSRGEPGAACPSRTSTAPSWWRSPTNGWGCSTTRGH